MSHYFIELAFYVLSTYLLGCLAGAAWRTYFSKPEPYYEPAVIGAAAGATSVVSNEFAAPASPPIPVLPATAPIVTSIRQPGPVLAPTHPSFQRNDVDGPGDMKKSRPKGLSAPRNGKADDLQLIVGIGPKYEKSLNNLGMYHFDQLANLSQEQATWVDDHLRFEGRMEREEWIEQARLLADGDTAQFNTMYGNVNQKVAKPKGISVARGGKPDDLKRISGIGPKNQKVLHDLGIFHFDQIANWSKDEVVWVDGHLRFNGRIAREEWTRQAKLLADGNESEFKRLYGTGGEKGRDGDAVSGSRTRKS